MLCDEPPIPLRVLDFLDDTVDLVNLALVCKATHQAGHHLLEREFPDGLGLGDLTREILRWRIQERKRAMCMLGNWRVRPNPSNHTASPSTPDPSPGPNGSINVPTAVRNDAHDFLDLRRESYRGRNVESQYCLFSLWAAATEPKQAPGVPEQAPGVPKQGPRVPGQAPGVPKEAPRVPGQARGVPDFLHPPGSDKQREGESDPLLPDSRLFEEWKGRMFEGLQDRIIPLDSEGVARAITQWDARKASRPAGSIREAYWMNVLRAAHREGQGVIVYPTQMHS